MIAVESAYVLASREMERIRTENRELQRKRRAEAVRKEPRIGDIEAEMMKCGTRLLKCVLYKNDNFEEIKEKIQSLRDEKCELLRKNGFPEDYTDDIYSCPKCRDTGFVDGKRCACLKRLILKYISANSNLTEYMLEQKFENFDFSLFEGQEDAGRSVLKVVQSICERASVFAEGFEKTHENLLILGNAGTGKTFVTSCIANRALERGKTVYYQTAFRLFDIFERAKFGKEDAEEAEEVVRYVYDVDLLIIDDLGTEFVTQFTTAAFFDVINSRIISGKSTIISSNLDFEKLSEIYSQRITSRFMGDYTIVQTVGRDLRAVIKRRNKR